MASEDFDYFVKPWVTRAILDEKSQPDYLPWQNCPTDIQRATAKQTRVGRLQKHGRLDKGIARLAHILSNCTKHHPCFSGACPDCAGILQRWLARASCRAFRR